MTFHCSKWCKFSPCFTRNKHSLSVEAGHMYNTAFPAHIGLIQWNKIHSIGLLPTGEKNDVQEHKGHKKLQSSYYLFSTGENSCAAAPVILRSGSTLSKIRVLLHAVENHQRYETYSQMVHAGQSQFPYHLPYLCHAIFHH